MKKLLTLTAAAAAALSVDAKTLALWPMELDPDSGANIEGTVRPSGMMIIVR